MAWILAIILTHLCHGKLLQKDKFQSFGGQNQNFKKGNEQKKKKKKKINIEKKNKKK